MKKVKKYIIYALIIMIFCISGYIYIDKINLENKNTIDSVMDIYKNKEIDTELIEKIESDILKKNNKTTNDDFIMGYINYMKGNNVIANAYFKIVIDNLDNDTNIIAKIYSYKFVAEDKVKKGEEKEAVEYVEECFNSIDIKTYNKYYKEIKDMLTTIVSIDTGRDVIGNLYEKIVNDIKIDKEAKWYTYRMMSSIYYANGEYTRAIEANLKVIDMADDYEDGEYYKAKSTVDLALIYIYLGEYNLGKDLLESVDQINITNKEFDAAIKCYSLLNLAEVDILLENYDEAINRMNQLDKYKDYFIEDNWNDYNILKDIIIAESYVYKGLYEEAEQLLKDASYLMEIDETEMYTDKDIKYYTVSGKLAEFLNNIEEALKFYEQALELCVMRNNKEYKGPALDNLIRVHKSIDDDYNQLDYMQQKAEFINERNSDINKSTIFHISQKYEYEKLIIKNIKYEYVYVFILILGATILIITSLFSLKLYDRSKHDGLTNIYNRGYLNKTYNKLINKNKEFFVIMFDIDNFKSLNDTYGHYFGDVVLVNISKVIKNILNKSKEFFRYGGEEFIIIVKNKSKEETIALAEQIRKRVEEMKWNEDAKVTVSIGISFFDGKEKDVLKEADDNLYTSKTTGKNKITIT